MLHSGSVSWQPVPVVWPLLGYRLNGILIMFGTCHFFLARTVVDAEAYHNCTNQANPTKVFLSIFTCLPYYIIILVSYLSIAALINDRNKGCGFQYCTAVLGMELDSDEPF